VIEIEVKWFNYNKKIEGVVDYNTLFY
jgi:hypothetical protein